MIHGRIFFADISGAVTTAVDLLEINPASGKPVLIMGLRIGQSNRTASEAWRVTMQRSHSTSGSGGSAITARPTMPGDSAFSGTCEALNTTRATGGSPVTMYENGFNILQGLIEQFTPDEWILVTDRIIVGLETTPGASTTVEATATFLEIG